MATKDLCALILNVLHCVQLMQANIWHPPSPRITRAHTSQAAEGSIVVIETLSLDK